MIKIKHTKSLCILLLLFSAGALFSYDTPNSLGFAMSLGIGEEGIERGFVSYNYRIADTMDINFGVSDTLSKINSIECHEIAADFLLSYDMLQTRKLPFYNNIALGYSIYQSTGSDLRANGIEQYGHGFSLESSLGLQYFHREWTFYGGGIYQYKGKRYTTTVLDTSGESYTAILDFRNHMFGPEMGVIWEQETFKLQFNTIVYYTDELTWSMIHPGLRVYL